MMTRLMNGFGIPMDRKVRELICSDPAALPFNLMSPKGAA